MDWFRGWFLTGFPCLSLGYSQTGSFLSGYAAVLGVYGLSWLTALSSSLFLVPLLHSNNKKILSLPENAFIIGIINKESNVTNPIIPTVTKVYRIWL